MKKVISPKNLPTKLPIGTTILSTLVVKVFQPNQYIVGALILALIIVWIVSIIGIYDQKHTDIFDKK